VFRLDPKDGVNKSLLITKLHCNPISSIHGGCVSMLGAFVPFQTSPLRRETMTPSSIRTNLFSGLSPGIDCGFSISEFVKKGANPMSTSTILFDRRNMQPSSQIDVDWIDFPT
jgi:hypothetical protein